MHAALSPDAYVLAPHVAHAAVAPAYDTAVPAAHGVHAVAEPVLYEPGEHETGAADVEAHA